MRHVYKTREFGRWMGKTPLTDQALCQAVKELEQGLIDADLGGGVLKKRVPLPGRGKSGGTRALIATNRGDRWFFVYGFEKSERANVTVKELAALQALASDLLALTVAGRAALVQRGALKEICHEQEAD